MASDFSYPTHTNNRSLVQTPLDIPARPLDDADSYFPLVQSMTTNNMLHTRSVPRNMTPSIRDSMSYPGSEDMYRVGQRNKEHEKQMEREFLANQRASHQPTFAHPGPASLPAYGIMPSQQARAPLQVHRSVASPYHGTTNHPASRLAQQGLPSSSFANNQQAKVPQMHYSSSSNPPRHINMPPAVTHTRTTTNGDAAAHPFPIRILDPRKQRLLEHAPRTQTRLPPPSSSRKAPSKYVNEVPDFLKRSWRAERTRESWRVSQAASYSGITYRGPFEGENPTSYAPGDKLVLPSNISSRDDDVWRPTAKDIADFGTKGLGSSTPLATRGMDGEGSMSKQPIPVFTASPLVSCPSSTFSVETIIHRPPQAMLAIEACASPPKSFSPDIPIPPSPSKYSGRQYSVYLSDLAALSNATVTLHNALQRMYTQYLTQYTSTPSPEHQDFPLRLFLDDMNTLLSQFSIPSSARDFEHLGERVVYDVLYRNWARQKSVSPFFTFVKSSMPPSSLFSCPKKEKWTRKEIRRLKGTSQPHIFEAQLAMSAELEHAQLMQRNLKNEFGYAGLSTKPNSKPESLVSSVPTYTAQEARHRQYQCEIWKELVQERQWEARDTGRLSAYQLALPGVGVTSFLERARVATQSVRHFASLSPAEGDDETVTVTEGDDEGTVVVGEIEDKNEKKEGGADGSIFDALAHPTTSNSGKNGREMQDPSNRSEQGEKRDSVIVMGTEAISLCPVDFSRNNCNDYSGHVFD